MKAMLNLLMNKIAKPVLEKNVLEKCDDHAEK